MSVKPVRLVLITTVSCKAWSASHPERKTAFWEGHPSRTVSESADFLRQRCVTTFQQWDDPHAALGRLVEKQNTHVGSGGRSSSMRL